MTLNANNFLSVFSQGDYRVNVYFSEDKTDLFSLIIGFNIKSPIKSSFGLILIKKMVYSNGEGSTILFPMNVKQITK